MKYYMKIMNKILTSTKSGALKIAKIYGKIIIKIGNNNNYNKQ